MSQKLNDLTAQRFGMWTVIGRGEDKGGHTCWRCRCECGTERIVQSADLLRGRSTGCGCSSTGFRNLEGRLFGLWTVIGPSEKRGSQTYWYCRCRCGTEKWVNAGSLTSNRTKSCGCDRIEDLVGKKFGYWIVVGSYERRSGHIYWPCRCRCGTERLVESGSLKSGQTQSCGCHKRENAKAETKKIP